MLRKVNQVVGIAFIKDGKLLICESVRSARVGEFTLIGGGVEEGEEPIDACVREAKEEINYNFDVKQSDFEEIKSYIEQAASDPNILIQMHIFIAKKDINMEFVPSNKEILEYHWYSLGEKARNLSSSIRNYVIPYAVQKGLMY